MRVYTDERRSLALSVGAVRRPVCAGNVDGHKPGNRGVAFCVRGELRVGKSGGRWAERGDEEVAVVFECSFYEGGVTEGCDNR